MENLKKDTKTEVLKAYVLAVNEMKNPANVAENPFHKSKYAPLSEIIEISKPILSKHGIATMQTPFVEYESIKDNNGNERQIAVVSVTTSLIHVSGEILEFPPMIMKVGNINPQAIGSTITYCRRYSLSSILGLAGREEDDDGNIATMQNEANRQVINHVNNNHSNQQGQNEINQPTVGQDQTPQKPQQRNTSSVNLITVDATVKSKEEKISGKGTPYLDIVLENGDGKQLSVIAKEKAYEQTKGLQEGQEATFKLLSAQGFTFVHSVNEGATKNE